MTSLVTLIGRSSSHFTRIVRIYAAELGAPHHFEPVYDIKSTDARTYENPLLTVPSLRTPEGTWFGSQPAARELARRAGSPSGLVWPEDLTSPVASNAQEVTLSAMNTGVTVVLARGAQVGEGHALLVKPLARLAGALEWLESNLDAAVASLPERRLSYLEVSAFCFLTHLGFRELGTLDGRPRLSAFCERFGARPSAQATPYRFDQQP
jgi:glutathione S-transferase